VAHSARWVSCQGVTQGEGDGQGRVAKVAQQKALPQGAGLFPVLTHIYASIFSTFSLFLFFFSSLPQGAGIFPALAHSQKSVS
jgi:hypothetical protein